MADQEIKQKQEQFEKWFQLYPDYYENRYPVQLLFNLYYYVKDGKPTYLPSRREMSYEYASIRSLTSGIARYGDYPSAIYWKQELNSYKDEQQRIEDIQQEIQMLAKQTPQDQQSQQQIIFQINELKKYRENFASQDFRKTNNTLKLKFDIGPLYTADMSQRKSKSMIPQERELVFDIDSDDYNTVRGCGCTGSKMCQKCWRFMECACCIMQLFCEAYGFKKYFFDFSGRRGMHCWICDQTARRINANQRESLLKQYDLIEENDSMVQVNFKNNCQNHLEILLVCYKFFQIMRKEQNWDDLSEEYNAQQRKILKSLANGVKDNFWKKFDSRKQYIFEYLWDQCKKDEYEQFPQTFQDLMYHFNNDKGKTFDLLCKYIIYKVYPRFDINVTKTMNHLLKLPFSVHSKSLWISLPFDHVAVVRKYKLQDIISQKTFYTNSPGQFEFITPEQRNQVSEQGIVTIKNIQDDITPEIQYFKSIVSQILEQQQE